MIRISMLFVSTNNIKNNKNSCRKSNSFSKNNNYNFHGYMIFMAMILFISGLVEPVEGAGGVSCTSDIECQTLYRVTSTVCLPSTKKCSNPFQQGCLRTLQEQEEQQNSSSQPTSNKLVAKRACNSDDTRSFDENDQPQEITEGSNCEKSLFHNVYPEIRVHQADWETSVILAWIYQIVLSELLQVPTTVGLTSLDTPSSSFYSANLDLVFSRELYPYDALQRANQMALANIDVESTSTVNDEKKPDCSSVTESCVDVLPDVWSGQISQYVPLVQNDTLQLPTGNGMLGRMGLYIPARTALAFPQFTYWVGLAGEDKRQILSETFLRPFTWNEYCQQVSESACLEPSPNAARLPKKAEEDLYFQPGGLYNGYFAATDANNCALYPTNCTGHIVTPPCDWSSPLDSQLYWNEIVGLARDGPVSPVGGYNASQMSQIYRAANATNNHILMSWYEPDPLVFEFQRSQDYQFIPVTLPIPSRQCLMSRVTSEEKCSESIEVRRGNSSAGACGEGTISQQTLTIKGLTTYTESVLPADQSPADAFLKHFQVSNIDMGDIVQMWKLHPNSSQGSDGYDLRAAVCHWISDHERQLQDFIPQGYPRSIKRISDYDSWYAMTAFVVAIVVASIAFLSFLGVIRFRNTKTMLFAQPMFLMIILFGFWMISVGAILWTTEPQRSPCIRRVSANWLIVLGYTIELIPVVVKTAKINHLIRSYSKTQRRIQLNRQHMLLQVAVVVVVVIVYLTIWTIQDPPMKVETRVLNEAPEDQDGNVEYTTQVLSDVTCKSESYTWTLVAYGWEFLLLLIAAFLAFQSRHVMQQLNESTSLAVMVYSHFLFAVLRGVCTVLYVQETFPNSIVATAMSLLYSLDALAAMSIYVMPKLIASSKASSSYKPGMLPSSVEPRSSTAGLNDVDDDLLNGTEHLENSLSILVCSANLGNKAPTVESLEAWIPPGGCSDQVKALPPNNENEMDEEPKTLLDRFETFDLIAIGMQEASWSSTANDKTTSGAGAATKKEISEEEIMFALEEANTAQLREMVQEVLGENYYQIADERRGQMRLHMWATRKTAHAVKNVKISGANTGIGNVLANKGGIVGTVYFPKLRISFITAHLAAHEGETYYKMRCENIRSILHEARTCDLSSTKLDVPTSNHYTFFLGDLNFRTRFGDESSHEEKVAICRDLIESKEYASLYALDELQEGLKKNHFLAGFETLPCHFPPTFKVERGPGFKYKNQRIPSYTDRILFHAAPGLREHLKALSYEACSDFTTSDHKPIRGAFCVSSNDLDAIQINSDMHFDFTRIRCSDLPAVNTTGKSDPYVMILWDEFVPFQSEQVAPWDLLRSFWAGATRWPRTSFISKTVNPYWKGEVIPLSLKGVGTKVESNGMLFLTVMNSDKVMGRKEVLGAAAFNVHELISTLMSCVPTLHGGGQGLVEERSLNIERRLVRDGMDAGRIKFTLVLKRKRPEMQGGGNQRRRRSSVAFKDIFGNGNSSSDLFPTGVMAKSPVPPAVLDSRV